jgi:iron(III) transport system ATP-binding protein
VRSEMREILREAGATAIFVTHDQEEALSIADEVAVMMDGTTVQIAPPEDLYHRPATREVASFVGEANFLPGTARNGHVCCALGEIPSTGACEGEVEAMLRPEALRLAEQPDGEATVIGREFYGHDQLVKLRLSSGVILYSRLGGGPGFNVGERVSIGVEGPVVVFPAHSSVAEQQ